MNRTIGLLLFASLAALVLWPSIPAGHAGNSSEDAKIAKQNLPRRSIVTKPVKDDSVKPATVGLPNILNEKAPMSAAVATFVGGRNATFNHVTIAADFSGRENYIADRAGTFDDFTALFPDPDDTITKVAFSEHTFANGFNENVVYYGDAAGNLFVGTDVNPGVNVGPSIDALRQINIPSLVATGASGGVTLLNVPAGDCTDDEPVVTGIAVNPVADLGDFNLCGTIGEVVYVSTLDTGACSASAAGQPFRTRVFAFAFTDGAGVGAATPAGALELLRNPNSNAGITIDDDGSLYFHLVDNVQRTNSAIFKVTETTRTVPACAAVNPRVDRVIASIPAGLSGGIGLNSAQGTTANPIIVAAGYRLTNFSGPSTTWGNIFGIAAGPGNVIYAALARSFVDGDPTSGGFLNPTLGQTPSMIISLVDQSGAFDNCTGQVTSAGQTINVGGQIPIGDGFADVAQFGLTRVPGVNNFRVFALGNGPDPRPVPPSTLSPIVGLTSSTLKLDMQIDPSNYSGIAVNEEGTVYVISGGNPAPLGGNPSPTRGEILAFQDQCPADRRADFIDFRGDAFPGTNVGDGDSDRFDHIFFQAPNDATGNPSALSGLAVGFLRYTNRLAPNAISPGVALGNTQPVLADDGTTGMGVVPAPILFEGLDPSHQVAGGDDQNPPFRGDDSDGLASPLSANNPALANPLEGGFEFLFGVPGPNGNVWNGFFWNSNGNITFNAPDAEDFTPTNSEWYSGPAKIAPAWTDLNPSSRAANLGTFPVQALGFAGVNAFKVRDINVPQFGDEGCAGSGINGGRTNTFAVTLYDDGTGLDENANQPLNPANQVGNNAVAFDLQEGPTDSRFTREPTTNLLVGAPARPDGTGYFVFDYGRMDLLGTDSLVTISGYSIGNGTNTNPPGLCEINLGEAARATENGTFGVVQGQTATIASCLIGEGTEPAIFERFNEGVHASAGPLQGEIFLSTPDYDLRNESNDPRLATPTRQRDLNRGRVGFVGVSVPRAPAISSVTAGNFVVAPNQPNNLINALGPVDIFVTGSGFVPNETTIVCQGAPEQRAGKSVTNAMELRIDNDNNGIADVIIPLSNVTPVSPNLLRGTLPALAPLFPGTAFPISPTTAIGPNSILRITTTYTAGDNNAFGPIPFVTDANTTSLLGTRAPVVLSAVPTSGDCGVTQNVAITGAAFRQGDGVTANVTSVTAVDGGTLVTATSFNIVDSQHIDATFNFPPGSGGRLFYIFANGPNGSSRNLVTLPPGTPAGVPLGNEAGNAVTFNCFGAFQFSAASYNVSEDCITVPVTITRDMAGPAPSSVDIATSDGTAVQKSDYTATFRTISFAAGETSKIVEIPITEDSFNEANETFTVTLSNPTGGAGLGAQTAASVTIVNDDNPPPATNAIDDVTTFVCQHYHDFLNRQGDAAGQAFWISQITACGANVACIEQKRISVSASFFLSIEFQETGFFVLKAQRAAFGKKSADPATRYPYLPFLKDTQQVSMGVIIGQPGALALLEANKQAYATQVVTSGPFIAAYPLAQTAAQYVDALFATAMLVPTAAERTAAITAFGGGGTAGRVAAFRSVVDADSLRSAEFNPAFVLMEYYGYLRRNPTDPPDNNDVGYQFWLTKLNMFGGNFIDAEMVKAFLSSIEYRQRFGTP